jgi:purine nucleoside permease
MANGREETLGSAICHLPFVFCRHSPRRVVVCDLLNPRPMLPRAFYFASFFLVLLGRSIADEVNFSVSPTADHPLKVKVVVVAMFEVGADTGDVPEDDRIRYHGYPKALAGPEVLIGATLSSSTYWHGKLLNQWAHDWVKY